MWRGLFIYFFAEFALRTCVCVCVTSITCLSVCGFLFLQVKCLREVIVHTCVCFIFACILFTIFMYLFIFVFMFILLIKRISDYQDS